VNVYHLIQVKDRARLDIVMAIR